MNVSRLLAARGAHGSALLHSQTPTQLSVRTDVTTPVDARAATPSALTQPAASQPPVSLDSDARPVTPQEATVPTGSPSGTQSHTPTHPHTPTASVAEPVPASVPAATPPPSQQSPPPAVSDLLTDAWQCLLEPVAPEQLACLPEHLRTCAWVRMRARSRVKDQPVLRDMIRAKHRSLFVAEGVDMDSFLDVLACGGDSSLIVRRPITDRSHPCGREPGACGGFFTEHVRPGTVLGMYPGTLTSMRDHAEWMHSLPAAEQKRAWHYDMEAPRMLLAPGSSTSRPLYTFQGWIVRNELCALNDRTGIAKEENVKKVPLLLCGFLPMVLFVVCRETEKDVEAVLSYGDSWRRTFIGENPEYRDSLLGVSAKQGDTTMADVLRSFTMPVKDRLRARRGLPVTPLPDAAAEEATSSSDGPTVVAAAGTSTAAQLANGTIDIVATPDVNGHAAVSAAAEEPELSDERTLRVVQSCERVHDASHSLLLEALRARVQPQPQRSRARRALPVDVPGGDDGEDGAATESTSTSKPRKRARMDQALDLAAAAGDEQVDIVSEPAPAPVPKPKPAPAPKPSWQYLTAEEEAELERKGREKLGLLDESDMQALWLQPRRTRHGGAAPPMDASTPATPQEPPAARKPRAPRPRKPKENAPHGEQQSETSSPPPKKPREPRPPRLDAQGRPVHVGWTYVDEPAPEPDLDPETKLLMDVLTALNNGNGRRTRRSAASSSRSDASLDGDVHAIRVSEMPHCEAVAEPVAPVTVMESLSAGVDGGGGAPAPAEPSSADDAPPLPHDEAAGADAPQPTYQAASSEALSIPTDINHPSNLTRLFDGACASADDRSTPALGEVAAGTNDWSQERPAVQQIDEPLRDHAHPH